MFNVSFNAHVNANANQKKSGNKDVMPYRLPRANNCDRHHICKLIHEHFFKQCLLSTNPLVDELFYRHCCNLQCQCCEKSMVHLGFSSMLQSSQFKANSWHKFRLFAECSFKQLNGWISEWLVYEIFLSSCFFFLRLIVFENMKHDV